jgi:hypothetical protein
MTQALGLWLLVLLLSFFLSWGLIATIHYALASTSAAEIFQINGPEILLGAIFLVQAFKFSVEAVS